MPSSVIASPTPTSATRSSTPAPTTSTAAASGTGYSAQSAAQAPGRIGYDTQVAALKPSAPKAPTSADTMGCGAQQMLEHALAEGGNQLDVVARSLGFDELAQALPTVPEALWSLLDRWWPSGTGWSAALSAAAQVTGAATDLGFPLEIDLGGGVGATVGIMRSGKELSLSVQATENLNGVGKASIKMVELPTQMKLEGVQSAKMTVDLGAVTLPTGVLAKLMAGDLKGAVKEVFSSVAQVGLNTQVEAVLSASASASLAVELGLNTFLKGTAEAGLKAGLSVGVTTPTESKAGKLDFEGQVGPFESLNLLVAGGNNADPAYIKLLASTVLDNLNAAATNSLTGEAALGMRVTINVPPTNTSTAPTFEVALIGTGKAGLSILGQAGELSGRGELVLAMPDIPGFVESLRTNGGITATKNAKLLPFKAANATLAATLTARDLLGYFPRLAGTLPDIANANKVSCAMTVTLGMTADAIADMAKQSGEGIYRTIELLAQGKAMDALRNHVDCITENTADLVDIFKSLAVEMQTGQEHTGALSTPGQGDVTGGSISGTSSVMKVQQHTWTADDLGVPEVQAFLRGLL